MACFNEHNPAFDADDRRPHRPPCCDCCFFPDWMQPIVCNCPPHWCDAENNGGPTLVIHQIVLEACGEQGCDPRNFTLRITGPSYPCGETFTLRAGSCLELDEPLVISGLIAGDYTIEQVFSKPNEYISTLTGPVCRNIVRVADSCIPTVVTIVSRRRNCLLCWRRPCGCR